METAPDQVVKDSQSLSSLIKKQPACFEDQKHSSIIKAIDLIKNLNGLSKEFLC